jgi:hypothetical protein
MNREIEELKLAISNKKARLHQLKADGFFRPSLDGSQKYAMIECRRRRAEILAMVEKLIHLENEQY